MTQNASTVIGSGTIPFTRAILPADQRGHEALGLGERRGTQVIVANPEDQVAVDAFASSGIIVSTAVVEIVGPNTNPLPRCREVVIENTGAADVLISHNAAFPALDSFELSTEGTAGRSTRITLPILHNVSVYGRTAAGSTTLRMLIF